MPRALISGINLTGNTDTIVCCGEKKGKLKNTEGRKWIESFRVLNSFTLRTKAFISFDSTWRRRRREGFLMLPGTCFPTFPRWIKYNFVRRSILIRLHCTLMGQPLSACTLFLEPNRTQLCQTRCTVLTGVENQYTEKKKLKDHFKYENFILHTKIPFQPIASSICGNVPLSTIVEVK